MNFKITNLFWAAFLCLSSNVLLAHTSISPNYFGRENFLTKTTVVNNSSSPKYYFDNNDLLGVGRDTVVVVGSSPDAKKWLDANPLTAKTLQELEQPWAFGYYSKEKATVTFSDLGSVDNCGNGKMTRTYTVSSQGKSIKVNVTYTSQNRSAYTVTFPKDVNIVLKGNETYADLDNVTGKPVTKTLYGGPLVAVEYTDELISTIPSLTKFLTTIRVWKVINWCQPLDLNTDRGEVRKVLPICKTAPRTFTNIATTFQGADVFSKKMPHYKEIRAIADQENCYKYDSDGYMEYIQVIKILDTIPPKITQKANITFQDVPNACKTSVEIGAITATDVMGITSVFLKVIHKKTGKEIFTTQSFPAKLSIDESNFGGHVAIFTVADRFGNFTTFEQEFEVKSLKATIVKCKKNLNILVSEITCDTIIDAKFFLESVTGFCNNLDNYQVFIQSPAAEPNTKISDFKIDTISPTNHNLIISNRIKINCFGIKSFTIWLKDKNGNWSNDSEYFEVAGGNKYCDNYLANCVCNMPIGPRVSIQLKKENNKPSNGEVLFKTTTPYITSSSSFANTYFDSKLYKNFIKGSNISIEVRHNTNHANGVNALDLILLKKHLDGTALITSKYRLAAADINKDSLVNQTDFEILSDFTNGKIDTFPNNKSWRFFLGLNLKEKVEINKIQNDTTLNFIAVKVGDLNDSAQGFAGEDVSAKKAQVIQNQTFVTERNFTLYQNRPNPFASTTIVPFFTEKSGLAKMSISDLNSRIIKQEEMSVQRGENQWEIDLSNLSKGVYFYKINFDGVEKTMKMLKVE